MLLNKDLNSDNYDEWTDDTDELFSFIYDNAYDLIPFDKKVVVHYKGNYLSLFELHGQGCFSAVSMASEDDLLKNVCIDYEDIVSYYKTGEKSLKYLAIETTLHALDVLDLALRGKELDIDLIKDYLVLNLK